MSHAAGKIRMCGASLHVPGEANEPCTPCTLEPHDPKTPHAFASQDPHAIALVDRLAAAGIHARVTRGRGDVRAAVGIWLHLGEASLAAAIAEEVVGLRALVKQAALTAPIASAGGGGGGGSVRVIRSRVVLPPKKRSRR